MPKKRDKWKQYEGENAPPHAGSMIESFRSIGYNLQTAIADIIDNSISAKAKNVWIDFNWDKQNTFIIITDDGLGMTEKDLINAMRPGSKNPLSDRNPEDLGRFGLGLKTASFSQCRNLTVATKVKNGKIFHRSWNLDYVRETGNWTLLKYISDFRLIKRLKNCRSGTSVIWQSIDHLIKEDKKKGDNNLKSFLEQIKQMEKHLQMVFHVYLEERKITIRINDNKIDFWNPYIEGDKNTKLFSNHKLRDGIQVKSYILPHHSKLSQESFDKASWIKGWNAHQGFYVYRNNRMIIDGEWLGMCKQEEHSKLARIYVNVPNTSKLDKEWQLDIKKSTIQLPYDIKQALKQISEETRKEAVEVYRQIAKRKSKKSGKDDIPVWILKEWKGKKSYQINRIHPIIKSFISEFKDKAKINRHLRLIEETLPLTLIVVNESQNEHKQDLPFQGKVISDLVSMIKELYANLMDAGYSKKEALEAILQAEPFNYYPELTESLKSIK